ncbi:hypothetical protein D9M68_548880 [compost metagenome]
MPCQKHIDFGHRFRGGQAPQLAAHHVLADQVFGQKAQPDAGHHHAPDFLDIGRRAHDAAGKALLIAKDGQRRQGVADLVAGETDEILVHQVFQADPLPGKQRMMPSADDRVAVAQKQPALQRLDGLAAQAYAQRRHAFGKRVQDGGAGQHIDMEFDPGIAPVELRQEIVIRRTLHLAHYQQAQGPRDFGPVLRGGVLDAGHRAVHIAGDGVDLVAQPRQAEFAIAPVQQHAAHRVLQPLQRLADCGLAEVQRLSRPSDPALLHHEHERAQ